MCILVYKILTTLKSTVKPPFFSPLINRHLLHWALISCSWSAGYGWGGNLCKPSCNHTAYALHAPSGFTPLLAPQRMLSVNFGIPFFYTLVIFNDL